MDLQPNLETKTIKTEITDPDEEFPICNIKIENIDGLMVNTHNIKNEDVTDSGLEETLPIKTEFKYEDVAKTDICDFVECKNFDMKYEVKSEEVGISYSAMCLKNEDDQESTNFLDTATAVKGSSSDWCYKSDNDVKMKIQRNHSKGSKEQWQKKEAFNVTQHQKKTYHCFHCDYTTNVRRNLVSHMLVHNKGKKRLFSCTLCDYSSKYKRNLVQHTVNIHSINYEKHSCRGCERHFTYKTSLDDHILKNHQDLIGLVSSKVHNCSTCGYRTTVKRDLRRHTINDHSANCEKHQCKGCEKNFTNRVALDDHILKHHQDLNNLVSSKVHNCPMCNFKTTSVGHFRRHTANVHSGIYEKFSCTGCEKHFRNKISLDNHIIKHHNHLLNLVTNKVRICPTCDYKTSSMGHFKSHLKRHTTSADSEDYVKLPCKGCEKHFKNKMSLDDHILKNHQDLVELVKGKVHNCPTCDYKTTFVSQLKQHTIKVHTGNYEKHTCTCCKKKFTDKRSLADHIIKNHQSFLHLVSSKVHHCPTCDYKTARKSELRRHMKRLH